jgi:hypothetical protein
VKSVELEMIGDPHGSCEITVVELEPSAWSRKLRLRFRDLSRTGSGANLTINSPEERDDFCAQLEAFLDSPGAAGRHIEMRPYKRHGGYYAYTAAGIEVTLKAGGYRNQITYGFCEAQPLRRLVKVLRSYG